MTRLCLATLLSLMPLGLSAQGITITDCDWQARADNIPEPWEAHTRTFSNGQTRLAMLDTIEPAAGWAWLMVISPPEQEWGGRQCKVIGLDGAGFGGMDFSTLTADYDPAQGLLFSIGIEWYDGPSAQFYPANLWFSLNQSTGEINAILHDN